MGMTLLRRSAGLYAGSAAGAAARLFAPRGGFLPATEPVLDGFSLARGTIGVVVLCFINAVYGTDLGGVRGLPLSPPSLADSWVLVGAPGVIVLLALGAICLTRREHRRVAARQLVVPVRTVITFLVVTFALGWGVSLLDRSPGHNLIALLGLGLLSVLAHLWYLIFGILAFWWCAAGPFRAGDGHPLLPPAVTAALAWVAAIHALVTGGPPPGMPGALYLGVLTAGPATVTALSAFEVWWLRHQFPAQFPFRDGPLVTRAQREARPTAAHLTAFLGQQLAMFGQQLREIGQLIKDAGQRLAGSR